MDTCDPALRAESLDLSKAEQDEKGELKIFLEASQTNEPLLLIVEGFRVKMTTLRRGNGYLSLELEVRKPKKAIAFRRWSISPRDAIFNFECYRSGIVDEWPFTTSIDNMPSLEGFPDTFCLQFMDG